MVRFQPEIYPLNSSSSKRPASATSLRPNLQDTSHQPNGRGRNQPHNLRPAPISRHHRTASANTRELLQRVQNHRQPNHHHHPLHSASSSSLSGLDFVPNGSPVSPLRRQAPAPSFGENGGTPDRPSLRQFVLREAAVVLLWMIASRAVGGAIGPLQWHAASAVPLVLTSIQRRTFVLPFWPGRLAEYVMGRLRQEEVAAVLLVHFGVFMGLQWLLEGTMPAVFFLAGKDESPSPPPSPWFHFLLRLLPSLAFETVATCGMVVSLLVLPAVLDLNRIPRWGVMALCYPLRDTLSRRWMPAEAAAGTFPTVTMRWVADALGGLLAGELMDFYFPDPIRNRSVGDAVD